MIVAMQHSTPQFNMLVGTGYWHGRRRSHPETGQTQSSFRVIFPPFSFSVLSAVAQPAIFAFNTMSEGEKDASSTLRHVAEQLLTLANTGKF